MPEPDPELFDKVVNLCKRRGFVFPSAEIYGGFRSTYDYGPLGVLLLRNVKDEWWRSMVQLRHDVVGLDAAILGPPAVWEASGHLANFTDPLVDCRNCKERFRLDKLDDPDVCPNCGAKGTLHRGPPVQPHVQDLRRAGRGGRRRGLPAARDGPGHVRELQERARRRAASGRRSASPRSASRSATRSPPATSSSAPASSSRWRWSTSSRPTRPSAGTSTGATSGCAWYLDLGMPEDLLRLRAHDPDELSHYSSGTSDVEFLFPWGWDELEGIANRGDYDLTQHAKHSGEKLDYFDQAANERYVPHVIEPAAGATRTAMAFLMAAYDEEEVRGEQRAPCCGSIPGSRPTRSPCCPLSKKDELTPVAREVLRGGRPALAVRLRRDAGDRPALPAPGRDRHAAVRHDRLRHPRGPCRHRPRPGLDGAGPGPDRRRRRAHRSDARVLGAGGYFPFHRGAAGAAHGVGEQVLDLGVDATAARRRPSDSRAR